MSERYQAMHFLHYFSPSLSKKWQFSNDSTERRVKPMKQNYPSKRERINLNFKSKWDVCTLYTVCVDDGEDFFNDGCHTHLYQTFICVIESMYLFWEREKKTMCVVFFFMCEQSHVIKYAKLKIYFIEQLVFL